MQEKLTLLRVEYADNRTRGVLFIDSVPVCVSVERPWNDNAQDNPDTDANEASCIPNGVYDVTRWQSPSKGDCFKIHDVPGRTDILIHSANWANQLLGCVAPGLQFQVGSNLEEPGVLRSRDAMTVLKQNLPKSFKMRVTSWTLE